VPRIETLSDTGPECLQLSRPFGSDVRKSLGHHTSVTRDFPAQPLKVPSSSFEYSHYRTSNGRTTQKEMRARTASPSLSAARLYEATERKNGRLMNCEETGRNLEESDHCLLLVFT
jgi:hypothetical protein